MMKLYFDYNVISYLRTGKLPTNISCEIIYKIDFIKQNFSVAFSPAHLEDIAVSKMRCGVSDDIVEAEIAFLTKLAGRNSLRPVTREKLKIYYDEYPIDCYKRVIENYGGNDIAEEIDRFVIEDANKNPISNPKEINNIPPEQVLSENRKYREIISIDLFDHGIVKNHCERIKSLEWKFDDIKDRFYIFEAYVNFAANLLEKMGYFREKEKKYRSRLHDVSHIIYAAYCDIFVSSDKKMLNKTKAIYSMLDVPTKVISFDEFQKILNEMKDGQ